MVRRSNVLSACRSFRLKSLADSMFLGGVWGSFGFRDFGFRDNALESQHRVKGLGFKVDGLGFGVLGWRGRALQPKSLKSCCRIQRGRAASAAHVPERPVALFEPLSKLLVSPLISPIVVPYTIPYIIAYITPFKEFRL